MKAGVGDGTAAHGPGTAAHGPRTAALLVVLGVTTDGQKRLLAVCEGEWERHPMDHVRAEGV